MTKRNILVTGGAGFIGSHLVYRLIKEKYNVFVVVRKTTNKWRLRGIKEKIKFVYSDRKSLENIFKENKLDLIIHLATLYIKNHKSIKDIEKMISANVIFPTMLLELAEKNNVRYFINTSTCFEYSQSNKPISEKGKIYPYDYYALTKLMFASSLKWYTKRTNLKAVTLKLFYPYGEMDNNKLIVSLIKSLINNKKINLTKGEQKLSFTYVEDIVDAYIKAISYIYRAETNSSNFNIGNDEAITIKEIIKILERIAGKKKIIRLGSLPYSNNEIFSMISNSQKAMEILNWKAKTSIEKGLEKVYNYYIENLD